MLRSGEKQERKRKWRVAEAIHPVKITSSRTLRHDADVRPDGDRLAGSNDTASKTA